MSKSKCLILCACMGVLGACAATCIVSGDMARTATGYAASAAANVAGGGTVSAGAASASALETRDGTEATSGLIPLDTRAPRGMMIILK